MGATRGTKSRDMRLKILACRNVYSGRNQLNHRYTIYEVDAQREDGQLIREKLRSYEPLPVGRFVDVTVTPFNSERYGRSFTLALRVPDDDDEAGPLAAQVAELRKRIEALEAKLNGG